MTNKIDIRKAVRDARNNKSNSTSKEAAFVSGDTVVSPVVEQPIVVVEESEEDLPVGSENKTQ